MIQLPRRSVTRFFIPLIDVLTLLFCIYLLMPLVQKPGEGERGKTPGTGPDGDRQPTAEVPAAELARRIEELKREVDRLREEKKQRVQERLAVRVLEIDAGTGRLYYHDPDRVEVANQADALALIDRQKKQAGDRELYYLFLFPRQLTGYPTEGQLRKYQGWFQGVPHGFDNPRAR